MSIGLFLPQKMAVGGRGLNPLGTRIFITGRDHIRAELGGSLLDE